MIEPVLDEASETLKLLLDTVSQLSLVRRLSDVQRIVRTSARKLLKADGATFVLRDVGECFYADEDAISPLWKGQRFPLETCISGWAMLHSEAVAIEDIYLDGRIPHEAYRPTFVKSLVMVPVRRADPRAAIGVYWAQKHNPTAEEINLAQALADSVAVSLEHVLVLDELAETVQLSSTDALTAVANRRAWDRSLTLAIDSGKHITVALLDLDNFKGFNDTYGHLAGDRLLRDCADAWGGLLRDDDVLARYGGEEFGVLLPGVSTELASTIMDRLRRATPEPATTSIGLATRLADETLINLVARADDALYEAKRSGRNRVVVAAHD
jgi:diguanylate cyclase (GGDEF)-like protein